MSSFFKEQGIGTRNWTNYFLQGTSPTLAAKYFLYYTEISYSKLTLFACEKNPSKIVN